MQLHPDITVALSTVADGSMRSTPDVEPLIDEQYHAQRFIERHHCAKERTVLARLDFGTDNFCHYCSVDENMAGRGFVTPQGECADGLVTQTPDLALFLPLADCIGAVLYHPPTKTLMLSHLGRHNLEQQGGQRSVEFLVERFAVVPKELLVYLSPAASKQRYPLFAFGNRSLHEVAAEQLTIAGIDPEKIIIDTRDTVTDPNFFSHSAYLRGEKPAGRHGIVVTIQ